MTSLAVVTQALSPSATSRDGASPASPSQSPATLPGKKFLLKSTPKLPWLRPLGLAMPRAGTHHGQEGALREAGVEGDELGPGTALAPHEAAVGWGNSRGYGLGNSPVPRECGVFGI